MRWYVLAVLFIGLVLFGCQTAPPSTTPQPTGQVSATPTSPGATAISTPVPTVDNTPLDLANICSTASDSTSCNAFLTALKQAVNTKEASACNALPSEQKATCTSLSTQGKTYREAYDLYFFLLKADDATAQEHPQKPVDPMNLCKAATTSEANCLQMLSSIRKAVDEKNAAYCDGMELEEACRLAVESSMGYEKWYLSYFGFVLTPFVPPSSNSGGGFSVFQYVDHVVTTRNARIQLVNAVGRKIEMKEATIAGTPCNVGLPLVVEANRDLTVACPLQPGTGTLSQGSAYDFNVTVTYLDSQSGLSHTDMGGFIRGKVQ